MRANMSRGMWLMLQQDEPDDYVLATGETSRVRDFVNWAFAEVGIAIEWRGTGVDEKGYDSRTGRCLVEVDPRYFRPTEVDLLIGDAEQGAAEARLEPSDQRARAGRAKWCGDDLVAMRTNPVLKDA